MRTRRRHGSARQGFAASGHREGFGESTGGHYNG